jgi:hypothetical protein
VIFYTWFESSMGNEDNPDAGGWKQAIMPVFHALGEFWQKHGIQLV